MKSSNTATQAYQPLEITSTWSKLVESVRQRKEKPDLPTKLKGLDEIIWGVHKRELLVIAARPGHGKTTLTLNIAWNLAKEGRGVVYCTMEMSEHEALERIACCEMGINGFKLRCGDPVEVASFLDQEGGFKTALMNTTLQVEDRYGKTVEQVEAVLKEMGPEVLILDHAQMISSRGFNSKQEALANYVRSMNRCHRSWSL